MSGKNFREGMKNTDSDMLSEENSIDDSDPHLGIQKIYPFIYLIIKTDQDLWWSKRGLGLG
jgi:hypothetical protein